jgi:hypothetical protein
MGLNKSEPQSEGCLNQDFHKIYRISKIKKETIV